MNVDMDAVFAAMGQMRVSSASMLPAEKRAGRTIGPAERVRRALARVSRDRWLPGKDVKRLEQVFVQCTGAQNPGALVRFFHVEGSWHIGLFRGELPLPRAHYLFDETAKKLNRLHHSKDRGAKPELLILKLQLQNMESF